MLPMRECVVFVVPIRGSCFRHLGKSVLAEFFLLFFCFFFRLHLNVPDGWFGGGYLQRATTRPIP